jgi:hypothetical protein
MDHSIEKRKGRVHGVGREIQSNNEEAAFWVLRLDEVDRGPNITFLGNREESGAGVSS